MGPIGMNSGFIFIQNPIGMNSGFIFIQIETFCHENSFESLVCNMATMLVKLQYVNTLSLRQNGHHFSDDIFKCIFLYEDVWFSLNISLKFVPKFRINNIPALVQIMVWRRVGDKPLSEPMLTWFTDAYTRHEGKMSQW